MRGGASIAAVLFQQTPNNDHLPVHSSAELNPLITEKPSLSKACFLKKRRRRRKKRQYVNVCHFRSSAIDFLVQQGLLAMTSTTLAAQRALIYLLVESDIARCLCVNDLLLGRYFHSTLYFLDFHPLQKKESMPPLTPAHRVLLEMVRTLCGLMRERERRK